MDFAGVNRQVDALEDLFALNTGAEVFDFENRIAHVSKSIGRELNTVSHRKEIRK
jgi:hypothetical protein